MQAKYLICPVNKTPTGILVTDGDIKRFVPVDPNDAQYKALIAMEKAGSLHIEEPDEEAAIETE